MRTISVVATGDVLDINCHSNLPYFFFNEGKRQGLFTDPVRLDLGVFVWKRRIWNLKQLALGRGVGGYQYSGAFLSGMESQVPRPLYKGLIISFNQVFPRIQTVRSHGGEMICYIDATIKDLADNPSYGITISPWILSRALDQERNNYSGARYVVTRSSWIIPTLTDFYNVDRKKIIHILPGANITLAPGWENPAQTGRPGVDRDLVLGFVGKDWRRKGLPFLLRVRDELSRRGLRAVVKIIGNSDRELVKAPGALVTGFIDKHREMDTFVNAIATCDFGCLFSASEALGISTLEFLRVGVPVAGFCHQGLRDTLMKGASFRFDPAVSVSDVADRFEGYIGNESLQHEMKEKALGYANEVTWEACVKRFGELLNND